MTGRYSVTYEIVTQESAELGDVESRGYIGQNLDLRTAIELIGETRTSQVCGVQAIEPNSSNHKHVDWLSVVNGMEFLTGAYETRSIHFPDNMTPSSRARLCKLLMES